MKTMGGSKSKPDEEKIVDKSDIEIDESSGELPKWKQELLKRVEDEESEVQQKIEAMVEKYDGLVSEEAAPILVGKEEYDLDLVSILGDEGRDKYPLEIENITEGMRSLDLKASVNHVKDTFSKPDADWKVRNLVIEDTSGVTTIPFWNEDTNKIDHLEGDYEEEVIIEGAYTNEEMKDFQRRTYGVPAVNLGDSTKVTIIHADGEEEVIYGS